MSSPITAREFTYEVERGIPIPERCAFLRTGLMEKMQGMQIGDSILVEEKRRQNACTAAERLGFKVTTRKVDGGVRLWRTE